MPDEFHGDETLLTSHETSSFSLLVMLVKLMIFNAWYETLHKTLIKTDLSHQERGTGVRSMFLECRSKDRNGNIFVLAV